MSPRSVVKSSRATVSCRSCSVILSRATALSNEPSSRVRPRSAADGVDLLHDHVHARPGAHLGDAGTHLPAPDDSDAFDGERGRLGGHAGNVPPAEDRRRSMCDTRDVTHLPPTLPRPVRHVHRRRLFERRHRPRHAWRASRSRLSASTTSAARRPLLHRRTTDDGARPATTIASHECDRPASSSSSDPFVFGVASGDPDADVGRALDTSQR